MEAALEAGAEDVVTNDDGSIDVMTTPEAFMAVNDAMVAAGFESVAADVSMEPSTTVTLDLEGAEKMLRMIDLLEDLDDVQKVYSNADVPDEVMAQM
jgi:transcriptional/translational regulatory protein YebC/TACO1